MTAVWRISVGYLAAGTDVLLLMPYVKVRKECRCRLSHTSMSSGESLQRDREIPKLKEKGLIN